MHTLVQVKAIFPSFGLEMVAQVYSNPNLEDVLVVELTRRAGDAFEFTKIRENLAEEMGELISSSEDVKAIASMCVEGSMAIDSACQRDDYRLVKRLSVSAPHQIYRGTESWHIRPSQLDNTLCALDKGGRDRRSRVCCPSCKHWKAVICAYSRT